MSNVRTIHLADEFSRVPFGRTDKDGDTNGTRFREEILHPALQKYEKVVVELNGTRGYGSSFLDEAFGGLIRHHNYSYDDLKNRLTVEHELDSYPHEIWSIIKRAKAGDSKFFRG